MLVSVIIPIYNVANYIEKCLLSALDQTYKNIEVILVDDCTPDNSMEVVNHLLIDHPRRDIVRIITHEKNKGLSGARNTGIDASKGEYLFFLDSDDWISNDCIELQAELAVKYNSDMVIGDIEVVGDARAFMPWWNFNNLLDYYESNSNIREIYFAGKLYMMAWNKLVNHKFVVDNDLYFKEGILHEDDLWMFKSVLHLNSISILNRPTYYYLQREGSIMTTMSDKSDKSKFSIINEMLSFTEIERDYKTLYYVSRNLYSQIRRRLFDPKFESKLRGDIDKLRKRHCLKDILKKPFCKRTLLLLPLFISYSLLRTYYKVLGKLEHLHIVRF